MKWKDHSGVLIETVNNYDVIECNTCEFKHIIPIPSESELNNIYKHEYYSKEKPNYFKQNMEDIDWWNMVYSERYETFEKYFNPTNRRLLDIGSGPGFFLLNGKNRGWNTVGIEPSSDAVKHSRDLGLTILQSVFLDVSTKDIGLFNVIHMSEVLEHVSNPIDIINKSKEFLTTHGILCIVVPNDFNPFQQALKKVCNYKPWWIAPPHHINYFNFNSLKNLLIRSGFEILLTETTFPIDIFLLMGDNYIKNEKLGRECHAKRKRFEMNLKNAGMSVLKKNLYKEISKLGIGREVVVYANIKH